MLLGLISDTHDQQVRTQSVLKAFKERHVDLVLHAGDMTSAFMTSLFDGFDTYLAVGNADEDIIEMSQACEDHGIHYDDVHEIDAGGARVAVLHGDDVPRLEGVINGGAFDLVVHGHSHTFADRSMGNVRVVNPGALVRCEPPCAAVLDTATGKLERILL